VSGGRPTTPRETVAASPLVPASLLCTTGQRRSRPRYTVTRESSDTLLCSGQRPLHTAPGSSRFAQAPSTPKRPSSAAWPARRAASFAAALLFLQCHRIPAKGTASELERAPRVPIHRCKGSNGHCLATNANCRGHPEQILGYGAQTASTAPPVLPGVVAVLPHDRRLLPGCGRRGGAARVRAVEASGAAADGKQRR